MNVEQEISRALDSAAEVRLDAASKFQIAGMEPSQRFDRLLRLVADFYAVPIATVSLTERHPPWLGERIGSSVETAKFASFCTQVVECAEPLVVLDTVQADGGSVQDFAAIRFYAGAPLFTATGLPIGTLCIADTAPREGFSERERRSLAGCAALILDEMELQRSEHFRASMMGFAEATELSIITIGGTGFIESVNRSATELFGYSREEMIERPVDIIIPEPMRGAHRAGLSRIAAGGASKLTRQTMEVMAVRRDGSEFPVEMSLSVWTDALGVGIGAIIRDISERRLRDARLMRQANHDTLTGLANRTRLEELLGETLTRSSRQTVLLLDLDGFKDVNDKHGHAIGDALLQAIAIRLPSALPAGTILARFGGDEFGVLLPGDAAAPAIAASKAAQAILEAFVEPFTIAGHLFQLGISIGAALAPEHGGTRRS